MKANLDPINYPNFSRLKERFLIVKGILEKRENLSEEQRAEYAKAVSLNGDLPSAFPEARVSYAKLDPRLWFQVLTINLNRLKGSNNEETFEAYTKVTEPHDADFLKSLVDTESKEDILAAGIKEILHLALCGLSQNLGSSATALVNEIISAQECEVHRAAKSSTDARSASAMREAMSILRQAIVKRLLREGKQ